MTATASHQWRVILWWVGSPAISLIPRLMSRTSLHMRKSLGTKLWSLVLWVQKYFPSLFLSFPLPSLSSPLFLFFPLLLFFSSCSLSFLFSQLFPLLLSSSSILQGFSGFWYTASFFNMTHQNFTNDDEGWDAYESAVADFCNLNPTEVW